MNVIIQREPNLTAEVIQMLTQAVAGVSMDSIAEKLWEKYGSEFSKPEGEAFRRLLGVYRDVIDRCVNQQIAAAACDQDLLQFYFRSYASESTGENINLAQSMVLTLLNMEILDLEPQFAYVAQAFRQRGQSYIPLELCSGGIGMEDQESYLSKPLVQQIQELPYPPEFKWNLNLVLLDFEHHLGQLKNLMQPFAVSLEREMGRFEPALAQFEARWKQYFADHSTEEFAAQFLNVDEGSRQADTAYVMPWIFGGNIVGMDQDDEGHVYAHIGILIQPFFRAARAPGSADQICPKLRALGDESKFEILQYIADKKAYGIELANALGLTTATISKHMSALRSFGLINAEKKDNNRVYFSINRTAVVHLLDDLRNCLIR